MKKIVGDDAAKKACFSHDPAAMKQVEAAIYQLVVTDKLQQREESLPMALKSFTTRRLRCDGC